jgi:hypothetical protein
LEGLAEPVLKAWLMLQGSQWELKEDDGPIDLRIGLSGYPKPID